QYKVYRSRRRLRDRLAPAGANPMEAIRRRRGRVKSPDEEKGGITPRRVLKWVALAALAWILISIVTFFLSAQVNGGVDSKTKAALSGGGSVLTGTNVLVLGSDERPKKGFGSKEPVVPGPVEHHLSGRQALFFARVRKNRCAPNEDDRARAKRQQQVIAAMRDKVASPLNWPSTFFRGPFIAWEAPQAIRSDMHGPGLAAMFIDLLTRGSGKTQGLVPGLARPVLYGGVNVTP